MKKYAYILILSILMSSSYYNNAYADEYTEDTTACYLLYGGEDGEINYFVCIDRESGYGITANYETGTDVVLENEILFGKIVDGNKVLRFSSGKETGQIKVIGEFKEGKLDGFVVFYNGKGEVIEMQKYKNEKGIIVIQ